MNDLNATLEAVPDADVLQLLVPERLNLTPGMAKDLTRFLEEKLPGRHVIVIPGGGHLEAVPRPSQLDRIEAMLKQLLGAA